MLTCRIQKQLSDFQLDLDFQMGSETLVIVGPSGNGKSMTLRSLAGLITPDNGSIKLGEQILFDRRRKVNVPPERRNIGFVFQNYALFPHLSVFENVAFGLRSKKLFDQKRVESILEKLHILELADRLPDDLSGGQQQRVALARALVLEPSVLLLDEPLSALDVTTRGSVRQELKKLFSELDIPVIFVTHDYEDAISLGDRILVLEQGKLVQEGTAADLMNEPRSSFVADFSGSNYFAAETIGRDGEWTKVRAGERQLLSRVAGVDGKTAVVVFPWDIRLTAKEPRYDAENGWWSTVGNVLYYGNRLRVVLEGDLPLIAEVANPTEWNIRVNEKVYVEIPPDKVHLVKAE